MGKANDVVVCTVALVLIVDYPECGTGVVNEVLQLSSTTEVVAVEEAVVDTKVRLGEYLKVWATHCE